MLLSCVLATEWRLGGGKGEGCMSVNVVFTFLCVCFFFVVYFSYTGVLLLQCTM